MSADPKFFFDTGSLALALVDTVGARGRSGAALRSAGSGQPGGVPRQSIEHLSSPRALAAWARQAGLGTGPRPARLADLVRSRVAADARALLLDPSALRACADPECGWLFLDRSQARRRRWCSMAECGNRAKARRFRASVRK